MIKNPIKALLIEDDPDDAFLIQKLIQSAKGKYPPITLRVTNTLDEGLKQLRENAEDVLLLDLFLPDAGGLELLHRIQSYMSVLPIIVITSLDLETSGIEAVGLGAQDYLVKGQFNGDALVRTIHYALERYRITKQLNDANTRLEQLAILDPLTELLNRRGLQRVLSNQIQRLLKDKVNVVAILVDLDDFKPVNEAYGHAVGDIVIREIAHRIKSNVRANDHVARIGGDEFLVILPGIREAEGVRLAEKIRSSISANPILLASGKTIRITVSMGMSSIKTATPAIDSLLIETFGMLSRSKHTGKNRVSSQGESVDSESFDGKILPNRMLENLKSGTAFHSVASPIIRLNDDHVMGYELLMRSSLHYAATPDEVFRMAMENNMLTAVDHVTVQMNVKHLVSQLPKGLRYHLNLFPTTLVDMPIQNLLDELAPAREAGSVCVEVSEQQIIGPPSYLADSVHELKRAGVLVAVDDVGFGRSNLESLVLLEPDIVKVDRTCVAGISRDSIRSRSLKHVLDVAKALGSEVIVEGIESRDDLEALKKAGVQFGQGHYWGQAN